MAIQYQVQAGDTVGEIARRNNVPISSVTGYKSNDPNLITPGEMLTINTLEGPAPINPVAKPLTVTQPQQPTLTMAPPPTQTLTMAPPSQQTLVMGQPPTQTLNLAPQQPPLTGPTAPANPPVQQPVAPTTPKKSRVVAETTEPTETAETKTYTTPSGAVVDAQGNLINDETNLYKYFGQYNISPSGLITGFQSNPEKTVSELVKEVMTATGLPEAMTNIQTLSKQAEDLANQRDAEIEKIQDNPWTSAGSKQEYIKKIEDRYDLKIKNKTNQLTLMQNAYSDARQQAQFAATTAINLYDKNRSFNMDQLKMILDNQEKVTAAKRKLGALTTEKIGGFTVLRDSEGDIVSTIKDNEVDETKQIEAFQKDTADMIVKLDAGDLEWRTAWDYLHNKYPQASIETIDNSLGLQRRGKG